MQYINQNCGKMQVVTTLCQLQCGMAQVCTVPRAVAVQVLCASFFFVADMFICLHCFDGVRGDNSPGKPGNIRIAKCSGKSLETVISFLHAHKVKHIE